MKKLILILAILFMTSTAWASPFLVCDCMDDVEQYEIIFDGGTPIISDAVTADCTGGQKRINLDVGQLNLADGQHSLTGKAMNLWGESASTPFDFSKTVPVGLSGIGLSATP